MTTSDDRHVSSGARHFPSTHLLHFSLLWMILAAPAAVCFVWILQSVWHDDILPLGARLGALAVELLGLAPFSFVASAPVAFMIVWLRHQSPEGAGRPDGTAPWMAAAKQRTALLRPLLVVGLLFVVFFLYWASWGVFRSTGQFLGATGVRIVLANLIQILQHADHMEPGSLIRLPLVALGLAAGAWAAVTAASKRLSGRSRRRAVRATALLIALLVVGSAAAFLELWRFVIPSLDRAGPVTSALLEVEQVLGSRDDPIYRTPELPLERRPLVSIDEYLTR